MKRIFWLIIGIVVGVYAVTRLKTVPSDRMYEAESVF